MCMRLILSGIVLAALTACDGSLNANQQTVVNVTIAPSAAASPTATPSASTTPSAAPSATPSPMVTAAPVQVTATLAPCRFEPKPDGSIDIPLNGQPRTLLRGEYELSEGGNKLRITKPNQPDTGNVLTARCPSPSFCGRFPSKDGMVNVPLNGMDRYLKPGEFEVLDGNRIRVTKVGAPDRGQVYTPPPCP